MAKQNEVTPGEYNIISVGTRFKGYFESEGNVRIDGLFEGDIKIDGKLIIGSQGILKGTVQCQNAEFEGKVEADVQVRELLTLKASSSLIGNVEVDKICIEQGAIFLGHCKMPIEKKQEK